MDAPLVPPSDRMRFRTRARTRWSDEDMQGVLNNAVYLTLFEEARYDWCRELGLLVGRHFSFVLLQSNVRFLLPGRGGVEVEIELCTAHLGTSSFQQAYRVREAESGRVWCEAEALLVIWDAESRASAPMPAGFREAVRRFEGWEAEEG